MNVTRLRHQLGQKNLALPTKIQKRNGATVKFDVNRIERAITACYVNENLEQTFTPADITQRVVQVLASKFTEDEPTVEQVQDTVELTLLTLGEYSAAHAYIRYRDMRTLERDVRFVPDEVREQFELDKQWFASPAQQFMFYDKYSRFNWDLGRRETWHETVQRCVDHLKWEVVRHVLERATLNSDLLATYDLPQIMAVYDDAFTDGLVDDLPVSDELWERIHDGILKMRVAPSMRLLAMAGVAARRNSMSLYNCSYLPIDSVDSFVETLLISMAGCGVGFSVEREHVEKFPRIARQTGAHFGTHVIEDSTEGWGAALKLGLETWWVGADIDFDDSMIRPAGAILRTKGGRASGPDPLTAMLTAIRGIILSRQGSFLRTTDAHLIECWVGEAAVQGGVRRTAMISLFDWDDYAMRTCKDGAPPALAITPVGTSVLHNSNNSAVWPEDVSDLDIMQQLLDMAKANSGEPGIFSRSNAIRTKPARREAAPFGTNPCGEILLRPFEFCNLSQAIARSGDTVEDLRDKVELATVIGMIQSLSTRFPGLRPDWKQNCEEERLLGVDLTAQAGCELLQKTSPEGEALRDELVFLSLDIATEWADEFDINVPAAITTGKPAGNSAEAYGVTSGISSAKGRFILRRYTVGTTSPLFRVLQDAKVPMEPKHGSTVANATQWIAEIPRRYPDNVKVVTEESIIDQLDFWLMNKLHWTEHNPSFTAVYKPHELVDMVKWVVDHKDLIGGLSFYPANDAIYKQAPFLVIDQETFERLDAEFPEIDYSMIYAYEINDMTTAAQELACFAGDGACAI